MLAGEKIKQIKKRQEQKRYDIFWR